jgi:hypothetical protein
MERFFVEGNDDQFAIEGLTLEFGWLWQSCHICFTTRFLTLASLMSAESMRDQIALACLRCKILYSARFSIG